MKEKKEDKVLRDIFRQKLGNAEVVPSPSVRTDLLHRLERREFMHFNPARFNIWYACGIIAAGVAAAIILFSNPEKKDKISPDYSPVGTGKIIATDNQSLKLTEPEGGEKLADDFHGTKKQTNNRSEISSEIFHDNKTAKDNTEQNKGIPERTEAAGSLDNDRLIPEVIAEKNKLRNVKEVECLISASVSEGCIPLKVKFINKALGYDSCRWTFGDGGYSEERNPEWIFDVEGEYEVSLKLFGPDRIEKVYAYVINVYPKPVARFEIIPEDAILPDDEISFNNFSTGAVKFRWYFGDSNTSELFAPRHHYSKFWNYSVSLVAYSEQGCTDTLIISDAFTGSGYYIEFPNAFIPNPEGPSNGYYSSKTDESAHVFHPAFSGVSEYQLRIFSKRGVLIFESNDINIGWDGYYKGQISEQGVYIWKVRGKFINREPFTKMGDVILLKK